MMDDISDDHSASAQRKLAVRSIPLFVWMVGGLALFFALTGILMGAVNSYRVTTQANQDVAAVVRLARQYSMQECRAKAGAEQKQCNDTAKVSVAISRMEAIREYNDLLAQQRMAIWTALMSIVGSIGLAVSALGMWLLFETLRETRAAARYAEQQAKIARDNADAFIQRERAQIGVGGTFARLENGELLVTLKALNGGGAAAIIDGLYFLVRSQSDWADENGTLTHQYEKIATAGQERLFEVAIDQPPLDGSEVQVFLQGYVRYRTLTLSDRRTHFCFRVRISFSNLSSAPSVVISDQQCFGIPYDT